MFYLAENAADAADVADAADAAYVDARPITSTSCLLRREREPCSDADAIIITIHDGSAAAWPLATTAIRAALPNSAPGRSPRQAQETHKSGIARRIEGES